MNTYTSRTKSTNNRILKKVKEAWNKWWHITIMMKRNGEAKRRREVLRYIQNLIHLKSQRFAQHMRSILIVNTNSHSHQFQAHLQTAKGTILSKLKLCATKDLMIKILISRRLTGCSFRLEIYTTKKESSIQTEPLTWRNWFEILIKSTRWNSNIIITWGKQRLDYRKRKRKSII